MKYSDEITSKGYTTPDLLPKQPQEIDKLRRSIKSFKDGRKENPIYNKIILRDFHLFSLPVLKLILNPEIIEILKNVLGENLIVWRSRIFYKEPAAPEIGWHQDWGEFRGEEFGENQPSLSRGVSELEVPSLTVWFPLQDTTIENGTMQVLPRSHRDQQVFEMTDYKDSAFFQGTAGGAKGNNLNNTNGSLRTKGSVVDPKFIDSSKVDTLEFQKGQPLIFTERTLHRSLPNQSQNDRIAVNFRVTSSDTLVYPDRLSGNYIDNSGVSIANHKSILISGRDLNGSNNLIDATKYKN